MKPEPGPTTRQTPPHTARWWWLSARRGRGRRGRAWTPVPGGLTFSVLLRGGGEDGQTPLTLPELALMPLAAGVAVQAACGAGGLKWPNDLLAPDGRKLAGILLEADLRGEEARRAVLGIGLNVSGARQAQPT